MKKARLILFGCALLSAAAPTAGAADTQEEAEEALFAAVMAGDEEAGRAAIAAWEALPEPLRSGKCPDWEELSLLSRAIYACTGNRTFEDAWRLCVGEVILNRVASPEFPDTLEGVIRADVRYSGRVSGYFDALRPERSSVEAAWRLLRGERVMDDPTVVWQSERRGGRRVCKTLYDYRVDAVYFCYTDRPELYG